MKRLAALTRYVIAAAFLFAGAVAYVIAFGALVLFGLLFGAFL